GMVSPELPLASCRMASPGILERLLDDRTRPGPDAGFRGTGLSAWFPRLRFPAFPSVHDLDYFRVLQTECERSRLASLRTVLVSTMAKPADRRDDYPKRLNYVRNRIGTIK